ncbi:hypothetical protein LG202_19060 [Methylobacillus methanolivorans]
MYLVLLLAMLQVLSPLIHAHPAGTPLSGMGSGIHVHDVLSGFDNNWTMPVVHTQHHYVQVIGVGNAYEPERLNLPNLFLLASCLLLALCFGGATRRVYWREHNCRPTPTPTYFSSPLRAPPLR